MDSISWITISVLAADWIIRIGLAVRIIMRRASVPVSLAWLLIVLFMPFVGFVVYLLVGENRLGRRRVRRFNELTAGIDTEAVALWRRHHLDWLPQEDFYRHAAKMGTAVSGLPPLTGNTLELISDTSGMLDRLIADIDAARQHCHLLYYIWMNGGRGVDVANAMIRAAKRGVECRVIVDAVGSKHFLRSAAARRMRDSGVKVTAALPVNPLLMLLARIDLRNHRKIAVIDGRIGYAGSQNINDDTFNFDPRRGIGPWIDATLRLEGPAVHALQVVFLRDWLADSEENLNPLGRFFPEEVLAGEGPSVLHVIPSGPGAPLDAVHQTFLATIYAATEELLITTPYFVPDEASKAALCTAAMRGVEVTIVVPEILDAPIVAAAARSHYLDLLDAGIRIFHYRGGLLHSKTMTADRRLAIIGSANLDMRSFWLNFEITLFIYDDDFSSLVRFMQRGYLNNSVQISREKWLRRSLLRQFADNVAQLFSPLL